MTGHTTFAVGTGSRVPPRVLRGTIDSKECRLFPPDPAEGDFRTVFPSPWAQIRHAVAVAGAVGRRRAWRASWVAAALALGACQADLGLPEGAQILCEADATGCPGDMVCNTEARVCVPAQTRDVEPPAAQGMPFLGGSPAADGGELEVRLTLDEPLGRWSKVYLDAGEEGGQHDFGPVEPTEASESSRQWLLAVRAGGLPEGTFPVVAVLADRWANQTTLQVGQATVDFTPPGLIGLGRAGPERLKHGAEAVVRLEPTEPLTGHPAVTLGGQAMERDDTGDDAAGAAERRYRRTVDEEVDEEGAADVVVRLTDAAGNEAEHTAPGLFHLDFHEPTLAEPKPEVGPSAAREGDTVLVQLSLSEPVFEEPPPVLRSDPPDLEFTWKGVSAGRHTFQHEIPHEAASSDYRLLLDATDLAHNEARGLHVEDLGVDSAIPTIDGPRILDGRGSDDPQDWAEADRFSAQPGHDRAIVAFEVADAFLTGKLEIDVELQSPVGSLDLGPACEEAEGRWTCRLVVAEEMELSDGPVVLAGGVTPGRVSVAVRDPAGNSAFAARELIFDLDPPGVLQAAVAYVPAMDNPIATPTRATRGTAVAVTVVVDEPIDVETPPGLVADCGGTPLSFELDEGSLTAGAATFLAVVRDEEHDGACTPSVTLTDRVGNTAADASFDEPEILLQTTPPVLTVAQDRVRLVRSPWGSATPEDLGDFTLPRGPYTALGPTDPLGGDATLPAATFWIDTDDGWPRQVRVYPSDEIGSLMGRFLPAHDGTWHRQDMSLAHVPTPRVFVVGVDSAGNLSEPVRIERSELVATTRYAQQPNPSRLVSVPVTPAHPLPFDPDGTFVFERTADGVHAADGVSLHQEAPHTWRRVAASIERPQARYDLAMTYDAARGRVVLFGGRDETEGFRSEMWTWDGDQWRAITGDGGCPGPRHGARAVYDSGRDRVVLYGGGANIYMSDTWQWGDGRWQQAEPGRSPPGRFFHGMVFDTERQRTLLFGGRTGNGPDDATWEAVGAEWEPLRPAQSPSARSSMAMAWDHHRRRVVLHGGREQLAEGERAVGDTWEWDGVAWSPIASRMPPPPRMGHAMAYDGARGCMVLFGGKQGEAELDDTWLYGAWGASLCGAADRPCWRRASTPVHPRAREGHGMAWDAARERVVLFGGRWTEEREQHAPGDTWEWDGAAWIEATPQVPPGRSYGEMAYDPVRDRTVLYGGWDGEACRGGTWEWDGRRWRDESPVEGPVARAYVKLVYTPLAGGVLLSGGRFCDDLKGRPGSMTAQTWAWNGAWHDLTATSGEPSDTVGHALAACPDCGDGRACVVRFGGGMAPDMGADLWEWGPWDCPAPPEPCWRSVPNAGGELWPDPRAWHAMGYDPLAEAVVLYGGIDNDEEPRSDTWLYDCRDRSWQPAQTPTSPAARYASGLVWDTGLGRLVHTLGFVRPGVVSPGSWAFADRTWAPLDALLRPVARGYHATAHDSRRGDLLLFGGGGAFMDDFWQMRTGRPEDRSPAFLFLVELGAEPIDWDAVDGLVVRVYAGGDGWEGDAEVPGATLSVWRTGGAGVGAGAWEEVATNEAPGEIPAPPEASLRWSIEGRDEVLRYVSEDLPRVFLRVTPAAGSRSGRHDRAARVGLDYAEVRLRYGG